MDQKVRERARRIYKRKTRIITIISLVGILLIILFGYLLSKNMLPEKIANLFPSLLSFVLGAYTFGRLIERNSLKKKYLFYTIMNCISISIITVLSFFIDRNSYDTNPANIIFGVLLIQAGLNGMITKTAFLGRGFTIFDNTNITIIFNLIFIIIGVILIGKFILVI